nr:hypothetical protein [Corynebacterium lactis]
MTDAPVPQPAPPTLAIVSATSPVVVWHVELSPSLTGDRLSGAWLIDPLADDASDVLPNLLRGCSVAVLGARSEGEVGDAAGLVRAAVESSGSQVVDLAASVAAIRDHVAELKDAVRQEKSKPGKEKLTEPRFPRVSEVEVIDFPHVGEEVAGPVLGLARGVEKLIEEWAAVESQRIRRKYLHEPWGKDARQLPLVAAAAG